MTADSEPSRSFAEAADRHYAGLICAAESEAATGVEPGLGGRLFYAGELDYAARALVVAANIAGAATLTSSAEISIQKDAIREGVIDFLVTSLDEALRILKNELRKKETVAVCVGKPPQEIELEMLDRGVLPDLLPRGEPNALKFAPFLVQGSRQVDSIEATKKQAILSWSVTDSPAHWLPRLDAIAGESLLIRQENSDILSHPFPHKNAEMDGAQRQYLLAGSIGSGQDREIWFARRWLRLAPRYMARMTQGLRLLRCEDGAAQSFVGRVRDGVASCEISVPVEIRLDGDGGSKRYRFLPPEGGEAAADPSLA